MQKWEYKVILGWPKQEELDVYGLEGWELVAVATVTNTGYGDERVRAYLKRLISN